ncbi:hypothetical protein MMC30_003916 [Trapelia coarctata]|nr:hypothetical protein [Trapelia coarctata]
MSPSPSAPAPQPNGTSTVPPPSSKYSPTFTPSVIAAIGPAITPRMRTVMTSLIQHLHDFARENEITAGKMSDEKSNEGQLVCDVLGLESLVDEITFKKAAQASDAPTTSAILGPFFRHDAPSLPHEASLVNSAHTGQVTYMHGRVLDLVTEKPIEGVVIGVWQANTNGLYEQQDEGQVDCNLRGRLKSDREGRYAFYCLRPTPYPISDDGPAGKLSKLLDRHPMRPAHIHLIATHDNYKPVTTQIFDSASKYLDDDAVFAVKKSLVLDFVPLEGNPKAELELEYDIVLAPRDRGGVLGEGEIVVCY